MNHIDAINRVGDFYYSGYGVAKVDIEKAITYYEKAALWGNVDSLLNLGAIYEKVDKLKAL